MTHVIDNQKGAAAVPLQMAVLCVDCESVSNSRSDECPVCGSHSLLGLVGMLGGTLLDNKPTCVQKPQVSLFDLNITIELNQMEARDLTSAIEGITSVIEARLGRGRASLHINVAPVAASYDNDEAKVA